MVDVNTQNKTISVNVSSSGVSSNVNASGDTTLYYSNKAREWAISNRIVDGVDYSSKYYAGRANQSALNAQSFAQSAQDSYNNFQQSVDGALSDINSSVQDGIDEINNTKTDIITDIEFVADGAKEEIKDLVDAGKDEIQETIGDIKVLTTLKIGQIGIAPLGIDETLNMERYLNGQIIIQDQFKGFTDFIKNRVALYPSIACLEDEWQTIVANSDFSQCGKFVIDDNAGTIRLPKVVNIQGLTDLSKLGEIVEAGLPNIEAIGGAWNAGYPTYSGALYLDSNNKNSAVTTAWSGSHDSFAFDASRANSIYGNSDTVQQEQIQYPYFIQVATGAETEDNIINEIELNNPFFYGMSQYFESEPNNISWLKSAGQWNAKSVYTDYYDWLLKIYNGTETVDGVSVKLSTEEYTDYDFVLNTAEETFRLPLLDGSEDLPSEKFDSLTLLSSQSTYTASANGWFNLDKVITSGGQGITITNTTSNQAVQSSAYANGNSVLCEMFAKRGDVIKIGYDAGGSTNFFRFIYAQGNGSLYYYVGETVQNANLINAGRIEEKLVDKVDTNAGNLTSDGKSLISSYSMPSSRYIDLTWGASLSTYTAPANGYFNVAFSANTTNSAVILSCNNLETTQHISANNGWGALLMPVKKGDVLQTDYRNITVRHFRFIYAEGEQ